MGFEVERFQDPVDPELLCAFCRGVLEHPVRGECKHVFCKACLQKALSKHQFWCPECKVDLSTSEAEEPDDELVEKLGALSLHCKHYKSGCEAVVTYHSLQLHLQRDCSCRLVSCEHKGCSETVQYADLESHMEKCNHRLVECKVCKVCLPRKDMSAHQAIKRCFEELNKRRMVRNARRLSAELKEHRVELVQQRHFTEQAERSLIRGHYFPEGARHKRAASAGPVMMRSSVQVRVGSAVVVPHYSRTLKSASIDSCHDCTNRFTHGRRPSARRHSHINVSLEHSSHCSVLLLLSTCTL